MNENQIVIKRKGKKNQPSTHNRDHFWGLKKRYMQDSCYFYSPSRFSLSWLILSTSPRGLCKGVLFSWVKSWDLVCGEVIGKFFFCLCAYQGRLILSTKIQEVTFFLLLECRRSDKMTMGWGSSKSMEPYIPHQYFWCIKNISLKKEEEKPQYLTVSWKVRSDSMMHSCMVGGGALNLDVPGAPCMFTCYLLDVACVMKGNPLCLFLEKWGGISTVNVTHRTLSETVLWSWVLDRPWQGSAGCPHMPWVKGRVLLSLLLYQEVAGDGCRGWIFCFWHILPVHEAASGCKVLWGT